MGLLLSPRLATSQPHEFHSKASEAAERATKSREVDLSGLKGFHLRFAPKMGVDLQLVSQITFASP